MSKTQFIPPKRQFQSYLNVKKTVIGVFALIFCLISCEPLIGPNGMDKTFPIKQNMQEQEDSWNRGDLEGFMKHYWKSDSLRFIGKSGLNYGWQKTLDNYKKSYPDKANMGTLKFTNKSLDIVGEHTIFVIGEWKLTRADSLGDLGGMYSLIWEQKNGDWVITTDHSS